MTIERDSHEDAKRLIEAFDVLKVGGDDKPFWRIRAEIWAKLPVEIQDELDRAFVDHLGAILKGLDETAHDDVEN